MSKTKSQMWRDWAEKNKEYLKKKRQEYYKTDVYKQKKKINQKKYYLTKIQPNKTKGLICLVCKKEFQSLRARASHEKFHDPKYVEISRKNAKKLHHLPNMPKLKDYNTYKEYREAYLLKYNKIQEQKIKATHKRYHLLYNQGKTMTEGLKKLMPFKEKIISDYLKGDDTVILGKKYGCSNCLIGIFLKNQGIKLKIGKFKRNINCSNGMIVKSYAEKRIVEYLLNKNIKFKYEQRITYNGKLMIPDFYIVEKDLYIEYAGLMNVESYKKNIELKSNIMQELNKKYVIITDTNQISDVI